METVCKKSWITIGTMGLMVLFCVLRIILGNLMGIIFDPDASVDDALLVQYAYLPTHFHVPWAYSLVKTMSFPLFLDAVYVLGISYQTGMALLYFASALLFFFLVRKISGKQWAALLVFIYILFLPAGFEYSYSFRLYRNGLIVPAVLLVAGLSLHALFDIIIRKEYTKKQLLEVVLLGIASVFAIYIKEDGAWITAVLLFVCALLTGFSVWRGIQEKKTNKAWAFSLLIALIPCLLFGFSTLGYKAVNKHYFGVAEIETRNSGELGRFVSLVYEIESENRDASVWAPTDVVEKAFEASPTLAGLPGFRESVWHSVYFSDIDEAPITGDFLTWVVRWALTENDLFTTEKEVDELFGKINAELEAAFRNGTLQKDTRFRPFSASAGKTTEEVLRLVPRTFKAVRLSVTLQNYLPGGEPPESKLRDENRGLMEFAAMLTHTGEILTDEQLFTRRLAVGCIRILFVVYRWINILFFVIAAGNFIALTALLIRKPEFRKKEALFLQGSVFSTAGIMLLYAFCICWFASFLEGDYSIQFYTPAIPSLLAVIYSLSWCSLSGIFTNRLFHRK